MEQHRARWLTLALTAMTWALALGILFIIHRVLLSPENSGKSDRFFRIEELAVSLVFTGIIIGEAEQIMASTKREEKAIDSGGGWSRMYHHVALVMGTLAVSMVIYFACKAAEQRLLAPSIPPGKVSSIEMRAGRQDEGVFCVASASPP